MFLHAGVTDSRSWLDVTRLLADEARLIAYDRRGFGETVCEPEPFSNVDDLLAVLNATQTSRALLVGNSQGGRVALDTALLHPDRVSGLVLLAPAVSGMVWPEPDEQVRVMDAAIEAAEDAGDINEVNVLEAHMWLDGPGREGRISGELRELFLEMNGLALRAPNPGTQSLPPATWDRLDEIDMPAMVATGSLDVSELLTITPELAARLPKGRFEILEGVAHLPSMEAPERVAELIRASLPV